MHDEEITIQQVHFEANRLMSVRTLRNLAPVWLWRACEHLLKPVASQGRIGNHILNGWKDVYLNKALDPAFLEEARKEADLEATRKAEDLEAARKKAVTDALAGAAASDGDDGDVDARVASILSAADGVSLGPQPGDLPQVVLDVAAAEKEFHEQMVPTIAVRGIKGKARLWSSQARVGSNSRDYVKAPPQDQWQKGSADSAAAPTR